MLTISPNLGNAHEYWLVTRTHLRDATMLQENRVADSTMTRKRCPCALCSVIRSSRLQSMVHGSHNTEAQFRAVQLCNEIRIMTLHPVPFSVGVSLGLSLGSVPESETAQSFAQNTELHFFERLHNKCIFIRFHPSPCNAPDESCRSLGRLWCDHCLRETRRPLQKLLSCAIASCYMHSLHFAPVWSLPDLAQQACFFPRAQVM